MRIKKFLLSAVVGLTVFIAALSWTAQAAQPKQTPEIVSKGEDTFKRECVVCHGEKGEGDGTAAYLLFPKPRNLVKGIFKIRSTSTGEPPTDENIFKTLTNGLPGSAMPSFKALTENERWGLVYYIKKIANITEAPESIIKVSKEPAPSKDLVAKGKEVYAKLKCFECHGEQGKGDGPSSLTTKDELGYPAPPNDFTRGIYKGGGNNSDIYLRFISGLDGTPMPSYEDSANEEERWALVQYVRSLAGSKVAVQPGGGSVTAKKVAGKISIDPFDKVWKNVRAEKVPFMLLWQRQESVDSVSVKAVHNGRKMAFLLEWEDLTPEARFTRHQDFTDGAAIQFPVDPKRKPLFTMGALDTEKEENTVNIWFWRADRQLDIDKKKFNDIDDTYAGMVADDYQLSKALHPKDKNKPAVRTISAVVEQDPTYITGWGAGNFASLPERKSPVENLNSEGFSTLTPRSVDEQNVDGRGVWDNGKWKVVIVRSLDSKYKYDAKFKAGKEVPVGFAVWNGAQGDRNGQKAVTPWYTLKIE
ncbi:MAG: hypothetical protein A3H37_08725 [Candidatus Schekmanbacteria bacterium RIFCSPLOWO2_02_FULL_38_14]|uniref:Cytochrome c domain-containing protein n=1 Tax=Candidatus Schekmanbacteria bacterium RIFCSPLOWO2_12_FULL_38_15 TaxID=1817883 RepID=A0A1F7SMV1_9BACT|nr:MAG: hypothetical protein A3H37_08725 [Candidatus Schekmanbacteria bacterium RIFCSPLOWO2_02_FULL_38_14]OGL55101.1 MAG: hypothetical protein A3G31_02550 [Candidatus Schekmanbacteria bacterium RIFCSPLOWO2_12_FULL_38_15]